MLASLKNRDYRLLWIGQSISHLGDQFHLVALPWLVLAVTHDPVQLGLVLAAAGVPRAALMLFGGAIADRFSPRIIMLVSDVLRFAITAALVAAILGGDIQVWMIYALAIAFGVVSGFFLPAAEATLPRLLPSAQLEGGNSLMMIANHVASFVGPALAGTIVAVMSGAASATAAGLKGIAAAFAVDALSFLASAVSLWLMRPLPGLGSDTHPLHDIAEGLRFVGGERMIAWLVAFIALGNLFATGTVFVGVPVLASQRLPQGAAAFGLIVSAYALGNLVGMIGAGSLPRPSSKTFGLIAVVMFLAFGVVYASFAVVSSTWLAMALMVVAGVGNGYVAIVVISSVQRLSPEKLLGRVMSLIMLAMFGLAPISQALAGALVKVSVPTLFLVAGAGMALTGVLAFTQRNLWQFPSLEEDATAA